MPVEEQVASIFAGTQGFVDAVAVKDVTRYEAAMLSYLRSDHADVLGRRSATPRRSTTTPPPSSKDALDRVRQAVRVRPGS